MRIVAAFIFLLAVPGLAPAQTADVLQQFANQILPAGRHPDSTVDSTAVRPMPLEEIESAALDHNPDIRLLSQRIDLARSQTLAALAAPDPSFAYRAWGTPLLQPWNVNETQHMFMFTQTIPASGKRELRFEAANQEVDVAKDQLESMKRDVMMKVRIAFDELLRNHDELRLHDEQIALARQAVDAARIKYTVGRVPQSEVLKAQVALTQLAGHLVMFLQDGNIARVSLNALMGRDPATPLEIEGTYALPVELPADAQLQQLATENRPDLQAIAAAIKESETKAKLQGLNTKPDMTIGAGYMLMPSGSKNRNGYIAELSFDLPWLNRSKHDSEVREAQAEVNVQRAELEVQKASVLREIQEASVRANSAKQLVDLYRETLRPQADAAFRATTAAYETDRTDFLNLIDSQNTLLDIGYAYYRALSDYDTRIAELERAIGISIPRALPASEEAPQ